VTRGNALPSTLSLPPRATRILSAPGLAALLAATEYEIEGAHVRSDRVLRIRLRPADEAP